MKTFLRFEKYFFLLLVALHMLPVLMLEFFVTHDGPAHVYNSVIISRLLQGDVLTSGYFHFNPNPVPNWLGHALMFLFNLIAAPNFSERLLLGIYISTLPLSFRFLMLSLKKDAHWAAYLVFPFIYSLLLYLGFYNFCIGIPLLFFTLALFIRNADRLSVKKIPAFAILLLLMYFSHIFNITLFTIAAAIFLIFKFIFERKNNQAQTAQRLFYQGAGFLALALLPCLALGVLFIRVHSENSGGFNPIDLAEYFKFLFIARPLITLRFEDEQIFAAASGLTFWILIFYAAAMRIKQNKFFAKDAWLILSLLILTAYFIIPDQLATGQFVTMRLLLFFFLFSFIWIGLHSFGRILRIFAITVNLSVSLWFLNYHYHESKKLSEDAAEFVSGLNALKEGSVVLPLNYSGNRFEENLTCYAGAMKNIFLLDNYEAETSHFPVLWKPGMNPYRGMNTTSIFMTSVQIEEYETLTGKRTDYVMRWCYDITTADSGFIALNNYVNKKYERIFTSVNGKAEVFRRVN